MTPAVCHTEFNRTCSNPRHESSSTPLSDGRNSKPAGTAGTEISASRILDHPRGILPGKFDIWKMAGEAAVAGRSGAVGLIWALELPDCLLALA